MIEFRNVKKAFGRKVVIDDVSFTIPKQKVQFIIGMSGTGKSVLMKHLVGLLKPDSGEVMMDGENIAQLNEQEFYRIRKKCGMVFQHSTLFDSMTLLENIAMPLRKRFELQGGSGTFDRGAAQAEAMAALELVHLHKEASRFPPELGAGVRKRAAIARALALKPDYLIYDEPTTALDPVAARRIDTLIREMSDVTGVTSLVISHDPRSIFGIADSVAFLYQSKLRFWGTTDALEASTDPVVKQFISGLATGPIG
jgi:phospholipid/cholesterol/gamma-HCH transport system ATP-binding protein